MYKIEISNLQPIKVDEAFVREVARTTLLDEGVAAATVSIALVDDATLRDLNRKYLNHDYDTDVLSFLLECEEGATPARGSEARRGAGKRLEGEVVVSVEMAQRRAAEFHWSVQSEVVLYVVHGLLHLSGYDDQTIEEERLMRRREQAVLAHWDLTGMAERRAVTAETSGSTGKASGADP